MKPLHEFLVEKFGPDWDLIGDWRSPRGGRKITKKEHAAPVKQWQKANSEALAD